MWMTRVASTIILVLAVGPFHLDQNTWHDVFFLMTQGCYSGYSRRLRTLRKPAPAPTACVTDGDLAAFDHEAVERKLAAEAAVHNDHL
jgi:hypothetical protein